MTDLHDRFRTLDGLQPPSLWTQIEARAVATRRSPEIAPVVVLVAAAVFVLAIIGGAVSSGSLGVGGPGPADSLGSSASPSPSTSPTPGEPVVGTWTATGSMIEARNGHTATLLPDGRVLVAGGLRSGVGVASAELFDPVTGTWTATGGMVDGRAYHSAALLRNGTVLVFGGISLAGATAADPGADIELASAEIYDPRTGRWSATGSMAVASSGGPATLLLDGRVLVVGGWGSGERFGPKLASAELYDPLPGTWTATGSMAQRRHGHSAALLPNGTVLVAGGYDYDRLASAELYDPATGTWAATGSLPEAFLGYTEILLPNGTVLIAGGDVPSGPGAAASAHAALYDVATGTWSMTGSMITPRLGQRGALLSDGRVLVLGGGANGGPESATFSSAEVYDPATGTWAPTAPMTAARSGFSATLLLDGRVLVAGGANNSAGDQLASAELFALGGGS